MSRREVLERIVKGAVRDAINQHGPITETNAKSAAKRIAGNLVNGALHDSELLEKAAVQRLHSRLARLQHGHTRLLDRYDRLSATADRLRIELHAERLARDPELNAQLEDIERRLAAGEPPEDVLGPAIDADEFRRMYLPKEITDA